MVWPIILKMYRGGMQESYGERGGKSKGSPKLIYAATRLRSIAVDLCSRSILPRSHSAVAREGLMPPVFRNDPYPAYNFEVIVAGISDDGASVRGSFSEVSGLGAEITPIEYRTGSEPNRVRKLPGLNKFTNIVLKR